jgi:hypothetical protein
MLDRKEIHFKRVYFKNDNYIKIVETYNPSSWSVIESNGKI